MRAVDAAGNLGTYSSSTVSGTTPAAPDTTPPTAPTDLDRERGERDPGEPGVDSRDRQRRSDRLPGRALPGRRLLDLHPGRDTDRNLVQRHGTERSDGVLYRVRAVDAAGNLGPYTAIVSATTQTSGPTPIGLVAGYSFDTGSGASVADVSGNGNTGSLVGAFWSTQGRYGGAMSFDGVGSVVRVTSSPSIGLSNAMTLSAWINPSTTQSGWRTIVQREVDSYFLNASHDAGPLRPPAGEWCQTGASAVRRRALWAPGRTWR